MDRPRILGLTASLINSKIPPNNLEQLLEKLERIMYSSIETASDLVSVGFNCFVFNIMKKSTFSLLFSNIEMYFIVNRSLEFPIIISDYSVKVFGHAKVRNEGM